MPAQFALLITYPTGGKRSIKFLKKTLFFYVAWRLTPAGVVLTEMAIFCVTSVLPQFLAVAAPADETFDRLVLGQPQLVEKLGRITVPVLGPLPELAHVWSRK